MEHTPRAFLALGDHVRLKSYEVNQHKSFKRADASAAAPHEPIDGLVLSIRDVRTGRLAPETAGETDHYVIEMVVDTSFHARMASQHNAPRGTDSPTAAPSWKRLRAALRTAAEKGPLLGTSMPGFFGDSPIASLLDGWKVMKVWSGEVESLEQAAVEEEPAAE